MIWSKCKFQGKLRIFLSGVYSRACSTDAIEHTLYSTGKNIRDWTILNMLGDTKLLTSDHQAVIDPKCIEGKYLFHFC